MNNTNRTVWIVVAVLVVLLLCCCVALVIGAAFTGLVATAPQIREGGIGWVEKQTEQTFTVGDAPTVEIDNFAGDIVVESGESGQVRAIATRKAGNDRNLERIEIDLIESDDGLQIRTSCPNTSIGNLSVELELFVPADARLTLETGAGDVEVDDVEGTIRAQTGAGNVRVDGADAPMALATGAGDIDYAGEPRGECTFDTGVGNVTLRLPDNLAAEIELTTGIGSIDLGGFEVDGETSGNEVEGTVGAGDAANIEAETGAGDITIIRQ